MIITLKKEITEEHEITLPMYLQSRDIYYYKILNEDIAIQICTAKNYKGIQWLPMKVALMQNYKTIPAHEFETAFDCTMRDLQKEK